MRALIIGVAFTLATSVAARSQTAPSGGFWGGAQAGADFAQSLRDNARRRHDDERRNAAADALIKKYGPAAGDPDAWLRVELAAALAQRDAAQPSAAPVRPISSAPAQSYVDWRTRNGHKP